MKRSTQHGTNAILLGHSIGPFTRDIDRIAFLRMTEAVQVVTVRERRSYDYLMGMGLRPEKIRLTADAAFCLEPTSRIALQKILGSLGIREKRRMIAIAPSQGISQFGRIDPATHLNTLRWFVQKVISEWDCHVLLVPHVIERNTLIDDRIISNQLLKLLGYPENVTMLSLDLTSSEIKGILGMCELVVAERMHAAIGALSMNVPTVVVGYSVKAAGIMEQVFDERGKDYVIPVNELTPERLLETCRKTWTSRKRIREHLLGRIPLVKQAASTNFDLCAELLARGSDGK